VLGPGRALPAAEVGLPCLAGGFGIKHVGYIGTPPVPVYFVQGAHEMRGLAVPFAEWWYEVLRAPAKLSPCWTPRGTGRCSSSRTGSWRL